MSLVARIEQLSVGNAEISIIKTDISDLKGMVQQLLDRQ